MQSHPRVRMVIPMGGADGRKYLDVITDLNVPDPTLVSEIKLWAVSYRDKRYPDREIRYDWEATSQPKGT
jgi:hypothetical protein